VTPKDRVGRSRTWGEWLRHLVRGCEPFIEEDGEVINGKWWGFCNYCGGRHAKDVKEGLPEGPWRLL
jgi:hypothetical protein